MQLRGKIKSKS